MHEAPLHSPCSGAFSFYLLLHARRRHGLLNSPGVETDILSATHSVTGDYR